MKKIKKIVSLLFSMKTALILLGLLIAACITGSVIPQNEISAYYTGYYPQRVGWLILLLQLDDVFHSWWFIALTVFLCVNLLGCNLLHLPRLIRQMKTGFSLDRCLTYRKAEPDAVIQCAPEALFQKMGFRSIQSSVRLGISYRYAVRNRIGIWGAWLTHLGMLIIIVGFSLGQMYTVKYTVYGVPGQTKPVGNTAYDLSIDEFHIDLREDETVEQYTAGLTLTNRETGEQASGTASVNHPLSALGMKLYQNSTGWAAKAAIFQGESLIHEQILCAGEQLAVPGLEDLVISLRAFYPDYGTNADGTPITLSPHLNNPAYLYALYYQGGVLGMNVLRGDERISVEDYSIIFHDPTQYTLIQVKQDPFTWLAGIGGVLISAALLLAFYVRTEELWAVQQPDGTWAVYGRSKKGGILFRDTLQEKAAQLDTEKKGTTK